MGITLVLVRAASRSLVSAVAIVRTFGALRRTRARGFGALRPGPVALEGTVVPIDTVRSAASGRDGVYVRFTADRWDGTPTTTGVGGKWVRTDEDEIAAPFELTDGVAKVLIDPAGADVVMPDRTQVVERDGDEPGRFTESIVAADARVVVIGAARQEAGGTPSAAYRGHTMQTVIGKGRLGLLIAEPRSVRPRLLLALGGRILMILPAAGAGWLLFHYASWLLPIAFATQHGRCW